MRAAPDVLTFLFREAGGFPNNSRLPVLVYKRVSAPSPERNSEAIARWFEQRWPQHEWRAAWRWGVYDFPHYHSTAHEILGVYQGHASLRVGHDAGVTFVVEAGDMLVLPAGTAHQNLGSSDDFQVVGGYPVGQSADLLRGVNGERPAADRRIAAVPLPRADPIHGTVGPLVREWAIPV
jgi:uncharacterized protein YjlB